MGVACQGEGVEVRGQFAEEFSPSTVWASRMKLRLSSLVAAPTKQSHQPSFMGS